MRTLYVEFFLFEFNCIQQLCKFLPKIKKKLCKFKVALRSKKSKTPRPKEITQWAMKKGLSLPQGN